MGFFQKLKNRITHYFSRWRELGDYRSQFTSFGTESYRSELVRACIRPLADFTGKAECKSSNKAVESLLNGRPNVYMNGREFLQKVRTIYELKNTVMIYIERGDNGRPVAFFPLNYSWLEALEYGNGIFIRFHFPDGEERVLPWDDIAVLRKDYNESNIVGDDASAILNTLELINTTNQGLANAVKATANLRGILKSTKAMLSPDDIKKNKEQFVADYLTLSNEGGIASLDATQEFTPISMSPVVTTFDQMRELRENLYRYYGVNDAIVMSSMTAEQLEVFYECKIEPFLVDLSNELTSKVFTKREQGFGNWIVFETNKLQFASMEKKIQMFATVVQYGGMTVNEWRAGCNMAPIEGGDELIRRLDAAPVAASGGDDKNDS